MIDESLRDVIRHFKINKFIETGTDMGETVAEVSKWFAQADSKFGKISKFVETGAQSYNKWNKPIQYPKFENVQPSDYKVFSVDLDQGSYARAADNFSTNRNITLINESSEQFLKRIIPELQREPDVRIFFFLDAHWGKFWPIRDELKTISTMSRFAIAIDDFFVPGKSNVGQARGEFGFDFYHDRILCWGYIYDCFEPGTVRVFYPQQPNRDKRGWCLITRGYGQDEVNFLKSQGLVEMSADSSEHRSLLRPVFSTYLDLRIALRMIFPLSWLRKAFQITRALGLRVG